MKLVCAIAAAALLPGGLAQAQDYPARPIRVVVPAAAGSGADSVARIVAQRLGEAWKQPVSVENRAGARGQAGTAAVANAAPDGYTLLVHSSAYAAAPALDRQLSYDPAALADVAMLGRTPYLVLTAASSPYKSLKALIDAARAQPAALPFASAGAGSLSDLAAEYLAALAGVRMVHVPFRGLPDAMQDVLAGRSVFCMAPLHAGSSLVKSGRLRALGVSTKSRAAALPDVPSIAEQGLYDYDLSLWFGVWAPSAVPPAGLQKLNAALGAIVLEPSVKAQLAALGVEPGPMTREDFARFVRAETERYARIAQAAGLAPRQP